MYTTTIRDMINRTGSYGFLDYGELDDTVAINNINDEGDPVSVHLPDGTIIDDRPAEDFGFGDTEPVKLLTLNAWQVMVGDWVEGCGTIAAIEGTEPTNRHGSGPNFDFVGAYSNTPVIVTFEDGSAITYNRRDRVLVVDDR